MPERFVEVFEDVTHEWRWRLKAANHEGVASSGESYTRKSDCVEAAQREFPDYPIRFKEAE